VQFPAGVGDLDRSEMTDIAPQTMSVRVHLSIAIGLGIAPDWSPNDLASDLRSHDGITMHKRAIRDR